MRLLGLALAGALVSPLGAAAAPDASARATFSKDVAPIVFAKCVSCHRADSIGPMPLTSYAEVRPWVRAIRAAVSSRTMPPWLADGEHTTFANDPRLSAIEIETMVRWIDSDAPEGDRRDLPALPALADGWSMGTPDLVLTPGPFNVASAPRSRSRRGHDQRRRGHRRP